MTEPAEVMCKSRATPGMEGRRDCHCPRAQHQHGTRAAYVRDRCRCLPCRAAHARAAAAYRRREGWRADERLTPAIGTARRLQALAAIGIVPRRVAEYLGVGADSIIKLRSARAAVAVETAARVRDAYDRLWDKPRNGGHATILRNYAARNGWQPPLAWDDDEIDDPVAQPHTPANAGWDHKPCGTLAAHRRHLRRDERPCEDCRRANARHEDMA